MIMWLTITGYNNKGVKPDRHGNQPHTGLPPAAGIDVCKAVYIPSTFTFCAPFYQRVHARLRSAWCLAGLNHSVTHFPSMMWSLPQMSWLGWRGPAVSRSVDPYGRHTMATWWGRWNVCRMTRAAILSPTACTLLEWFATNTSKMSLTFWIQKQLTLIQTQTLKSWHKNPLFLPSSAPPLPSPSLVCGCDCYCTY